jgi:hypothetical protein
LSFYKAKYLDKFLQHEHYIPRLNQCAFRIILFYLYHHDEHDAAEHEIEDREETACPYLGRASYVLANLFSGLGDLGVQELTS